MSPAAAHRVESETLATLDQELASVVLMLLTDDRNAHLMEEPMATTKESSTAAFDVDATTERIRALNEKVLTAAKHSGNLSLDAYEKTLTEIVDFEQKVAGASQLDWVNALASAHATFVTDVTKAYTKAAREALK